MPVLALNQPFASALPNVVVENRLPLGRHRFELTVIDERGNESAASVHVVEVRRAVIIDPLPPAPVVLPPVVAPPPVIVRPPRPFGRIEPDEQPPPRPRRRDGDNEPR